MIINMPGKRYLIVSHRNAILFLRDFCVLQLIKEPLLISNLFSIAFFILLRNKAKWLYCLWLYYTASNFFNISKKVKF